MRVGLDKLEDAIIGARAFGLDFTLTMPLKSPIIEYLDEVDDMSRAFRCVNNVKYVDGKLIGTGLDGVGMGAAIRHRLGDKMNGRRALVLGAGAVAGPIAAALAERGVTSIVIANRTVSKAEYIADILKKYFPIAEMKRQYAHLCTPEEKAKLQAVLWQNGHLNGSIICRPATVIAAAAGFEVAPDTRWILVEETGYGKEFPFSGEKLSVVVTVYSYDTFDDAIALVNGIQSYSGAGHSCGIHSFNEDHIRRFAMETKTARVAVRMPQNKSNAGNWNNGMPFTITLGCGTWGGNITCENITAKHYINVTWVARELTNFTVPTDEALFGSDVMQDPAVLAR